MGQGIVGRCVDGYRSPHLVSAPHLLEKHLIGDLIHRLPEVLGFEEMPITVHRDLQARMAGKGLHRFRIQLPLNPTRHREMPECMPVKAGYMNAGFLIHRHCRGIGGKNLEPTT